MYSPELNLKNAEKEIFPGMRIVSKRHGKVQRKCLSILCIRKHLAWLVIGKKQEGS
jgi:hypothetical protein